MGPPLLSWGMSLLPNDLCVHWLFDRGAKVWEISRSHEHGINRLVAGRREDDFGHSSIQHVSQHNLSRRCWRRDWGGQEQTCSSLESSPTQISAFPTGKPKAELAQRVTAEGNMDFFFPETLHNFFPAVSFRDNLPPPDSRGRVTHGRERSRQ